MYFPSIHFNVLEPKLTRYVCDPPRIGLTTFWAVEFSSSTEPSHCTGWNEFTSVLIKRIIWQTGIMGAVLERTSYLIQLAN